MEDNIEKQLLHLIATDRIDKPISSMSGKLKRAKPKIARGIGPDIAEYAGSFEGDRTYARIEESSRMKARGMRAGVEAFTNEYPRHGKILEGLIAEERESREKHLYFGMNEGCRITSGDYMQVMENLGFSEQASRGLYTELMDVSYKLARNRNEKERSILIG